MKFKRTLIFQTIFIVAVAALQSVTAKAPDANVSVAIDSLLQQDTVCLTSIGFPGEYNTQVGILIKEIESGNEVVNVAAEKNMVPASVMKIVTTASALRLHNKDFRFATPVILNYNSIDNGVCSGNLIIKSCGDPTFDSEEFPDFTGSIDSIVYTLKEKGINKITGTVIVKETMSGAGQIPQWEIDDVPWAYGAGLYGMNYRDNVFTYSPRTGECTPQIPGLKITTKLLPKNEGTDLVRGFASNELLICSSNLNQKGFSVRSTMPDPAIVYKNSLTKALKNSEIEISDKAIDLTDNAVSETIYTHYSPMLLQILNNLMVYSNNLFAEGMLRSLAPNKDRSDAITRVKKLWNESGVNTNYITMRDGSGLARVDRFSPMFISAILSYMNSSRYSSDFLSCFAVAGKSGTVKRLCAGTPLEGKLLLKSGSMSGVLCYAGYKIDDDGKPTHTVAIMINSYVGSSSKMREHVQNYLLKVFNQE